MFFREPEAFAARLYTRRDHRERLVHTIVAEDGSWSAGPLKPLDIGSVTFDKPGTYTHICKEYPWMYGQIIVEPAAQKAGESVPAGK